MKSPQAVRSVALAAFVAIGVSGCATVHAAAPPVRRVTIVTFYDSLAPYGQWIFIPGFGRVWRPWAHAVGVGFVPYATGGYWVYSDVGWVFESGWPWGAVVFHYGRWFFLDGEGWFWAPDTVWGPAWVDWRFGGGYVCWTPLPPPRVTAVVVSYRPSWYVVPTRYFPNGSHAARFVAEHADNPIVAQAAPIPPRWQPGGASWHLGPAPRAIASAANVDIRPRSIDRPAPLPPSSLDVPGDARIANLAPHARAPVPRPNLSPASAPAEPEPRAMPPSRVAPASDKRAPREVVPPSRETSEPPAAVAPPRSRVDPPARVRPVDRPHSGGRSRPAAPPSRKGRGG